MSDRTPIIAPSAAPPPTYVQTSSTSTSLGSQTETRPEVVDPPPPYTPGSSAYSHGTQDLGQNYQRFDLAVENQVQVIALCHFGPEPCQLQCPKCGLFVTTVTYHRAGTLTFISAVLCFFFCIICTFLPFCMDELQDVEHRCPNCKYYLGTYTRI